MRRGRESNTAEVLLDPSHSMLQDSVKFGSARSLNESAFSELVFETVGKQSKKKHREHRHMTLPGIYFPIQNSSNEKENKSSQKNGDCTDKKKVPSITVEDVGSKPLLSPDSGGSSKIARSPSFRRKKAASEQNPPECNIVLLGALGVGKTALAVRFVTRRYLHEYDPKLERSYEKVTEVDGENVQIRLWDTVNKDWESFAETADAFAVVYSITSIDSYKHATRIVKSIKDAAPFTSKHYPVILIGNKMEMEQGRTIKSDTADCFAGQNSCSFTEVSVATNNVDSVFNGLVKQIKIDKNAALEHRKQSTAKYSFKSFLSKNMSKIK